MDMRVSVCVSVYIYIYIYINIYKLSLFVQNFFEKSSDICFAAMKLSRKNKNPNKNLIVSSNYHASV